MASAAVLLLVLLVQTVRAASVVASVALAPGPQGGATGMAMGTGTGTAKFTRLVCDDAHLWPQNRRSPATILPELLTSA